MENTKLNFNDTATAYADRTNFELRKARSLFRLFSFKPLVDAGGSMTELALKMRLPVKPLVKYTIFDQFVGGRTLRECEKNIDRLARYGVETILDYGVEAKHSEIEYDRTKEQILEQIDFVRTKDNVRIIAIKITGLGRFGLFQKIHEDQPLTEHQQEEFSRVFDRVNDICKAAAEADMELFIDAEETWIQKPLDDLVDQMMALYNKTKPVVYNTFQLYRHDRLDFLKVSHDKAQQLGYILGAKLVRGTYMEKERNRALQMGYPSPIHENKEAVDKDYNEALEYCLNHMDNISFCCATHNEDSCKYLAELILQKGVNRRHPHVFFSQLYGMGEHITFNLAKADYRVTKLMPYGPVQDAVPYLVRRAQENSSVDGQVGRELALIEKEMRRRGMRI